MAKKIFKHDSGFTLTEIVGAALIIGITMSMLLGAFIVGRYSVQRTKHRAVAINLIAGEMETIMATSYVSVSSEAEQPVTIDDRGTDGTSDDLTGEQTLTVTEMAPGTYGYKKVLVVIGWTERGWGGLSNLTESAITYITQE